MADSADGGAGGCAVCGSVTALYALLLLEGPPGSSSAALQRVAYVLLRATPLRTAAVVGLDSAAAEAEEVLRLSVADAEAEPSQEPMPKAADADAAASAAADAACLRVELAVLIRRAAPFAPGCLLAWALLLQRLLVRCCVVRSTSGCHGVSPSNTRPLRGAGDECGPAPRRRRSVCSRGRNAACAFDRAVRALAGATSAQHRARRRRGCGRGSFGDRCGGVGARRICARVAFARSVVAHRGRIPAAA